MELFSPETFIIAAPSQNRENYRNELERLVPFLGARALNNLKDETTTIDLWNNIGVKMDNSYKDDCRGAASRSEYSSSLLRDRYNYLEEIGVIDSDESRKIICDDAPDFMEWSRRKTMELFDFGMIYEDKENMYVCDSCDATLGVAVDRVDRLKCHQCDCTGFHTEIRSALFLNINKESPNIILPRKAKHIMNHAANLPSRVAIERSRPYGLSLDFLGSKYVLDPKIGLAMLPEYISDMVQKPNIAIVQGYSTLYNTSPYTKVISPKTNVGYILSANIPKGMNKDFFEKSGVGFFRDYMPLFAADRTGDINEKQIEDLKIEHKNALAFIEIMRSNHSGETVTEDDIKNINDSFENMRELINRAHIREGIMTFRRDTIKRLGAAGLFSKKTICYNTDMDSVKKDLAKIYGCNV